MTADSPVQLLRSSRGRSAIWISGWFNSTMHDAAVSQLFHNLAQKSLNPLSIRIRPRPSGTCPLNELRTTRKYYTPGNARAIRRRRRIEVEEGKAVKDERGREGESEGLMEGKRGVI